MRTLALLALVGGAAADDAPLSEAETERLLREAAGWRSGQRNGTRSLRRAVEMYALAADRGSGAGARHGAFELARLLERGCAWPSLGAAAGDVGSLCARDLPEALRRFGAAAQRGHPAAQFGVAVALGSDAFVVGDDAERAALRAYAAEVGGGAAAAAAAARGRASREDAAVLHLYFAAAGGDPLANMALGARHVHGDGVPKDCDAALRFYERAADEAVRRAAAEGVLRPNARERLSAAGGRVAALEALWDATAGRLLDLGAGLVEHRDRLVRAGRALLAAPRARAAPPPPPPPPAAAPDAPWVAPPGAPPWAADGDDPFWGVGGRPGRGADVLHYYRHAASQGDGAAQLALGHLHFHGGRGVAQDPARAARLFAAAADGAEVDDAAAFGWAGLCYLEGWGVARDEARAEAWLRRGEKRGDAAALDGLGLLELRRAAGRKERDAAAGYFRRASEKGFMDALYHLGLYQLGWDGRPEAELALVDGFARRLARQERRSRKDAQKALQFFSLAAQNGHVRALHKVGRLYARALGVRRSCDVAANAYKTVAERGPWVAQLAEAHAVYARGDVDGARRAYARLAEAGYEVAQANAAWLLDRAARAARRGAADCLGTSAGDCEGRARRLYELAAKQGNADAALRLGDMTLRAGDAARAVGHYQAAHELRHAQATFALAWCYQRGLGVRRDLHLAKRHFGLAAEADADAAWPVRLALGLLYAEWGLQEAARRRPGAAARLGRLYDALGAAAAGGRRSPHDAAAATLAAALAGLVALRVVAVRRRRAA